jgi:hypothetical protein
MDKRLINEHRWEILSRPSPCDGCEYNTKCALDLKACRTFHYYVLTGTISKGLKRTPTRRTFNEVFYEDEGKNLKDLNKQLRKELL